MDPHHPHRLIHTVKLHHGIPYLWTFCGDCPYQSTGFIAVKEPASRPPLDPNEMKLIGRREPTGGGTYIRWRDKKRAESRAERA